MKRVLGIYGSGGLGRCINERLPGAEPRFAEVVFIDDTVPEDIFRNRRRMSFASFCERYAPTEADVIIAQGEPALREALYCRVKKAGYMLATIVSKGAFVSPYAKVGEGVFVFPGAAVEDNAVVEDDVCIADHAVVAHDVHIGKHVCVEAQSVVPGHVVVGEGAFIGIGALLRDRVRVGAHAVVAMGAVVMRDVPEAVEVMGNPARACRRIDTLQRVFAEYYHGTESGKE